MPALAMSSLAASAAAPSPRGATCPSRCRAALRRTAKAAAGKGGWASASFPSPRPRPRHVARAYAPARPGSSDEECVEWDETCDVSGTTETPSASPSGCRGKPLLCFVNGKSGGRRGAALMELLKNRDDINAVEIVDLTLEGPTASLRRHVGVVPDLRVLVCGGDGTVAWVLQAIEELGETSPRPPIGILPLGTGNDLARVFGWGSRYDDRLLDRLAFALEKAEERKLDRWDVDVRRDFSKALPPITKVKTDDANVSDASMTETTQDDAETTKGVVGSSGGSSLDSVTLHNYLGVGVDARAALAFHEAREKNPGLFFSSITNKALYGVFGAVDFVTHSCRELLRDHVKITADGVPLKIPRNAEGVIVLNLNSYAGGARMWDPGERGTHRKNIVGALLSGGYEDTEEDLLMDYECDGEGSLEVLNDDRDDTNDDDRSVNDASTKKKRRRRPFFGKSKRDDGLVDIVAVYGALHLGQLSWGTDKPVRLTQARHVKIEVSKGFPMHVDGQPWEEANGATLTIKRRDRVGVLAADPYSLTNLGSGRGYEREPFERASSSGTFFGWESWEELEYYDDLESAPHSCVRSMLD